LGSRTTGLVGAWEAMNIGVDLVMKKACRQKKGHHSGSGCTVAYPFYV
jgi:hypothetical protein